MSKTKIYHDDGKIAFDAEKYRARIFSRYMEKYRIIWMGAYKIGGMPLATAYYIMRKLWEVGTIAAFALDAPIIPAVVDFAPWAMNDYNSHRDPSRIMIVNENNAKGFPTGKLEVVYDDTQLTDGGVRKAVIGYAQANQESICSLCYDYVQLIVDAEMTIKIALLAQKQPFIASVSPETKMGYLDMLKKLYNDEPLLFVNGEPPKAFINNAPYIIDKLYEYKTQRENELLTYLGIDNVAIQKKERVTVDEANSNNDLINDQATSINANLEEFFNLVNKTFGTAYEIESTHAISQSVHEKPEDENDGNA